MGDVLQVLANGVIAGATIAVLAVSYSLIYGVLRFINFTFGELLMLAAYVFYFFGPLLGLPLIPAAALAIAVVGIAGTAVQIVAYRPFYRRSRLACLITALGVSIALQNLALSWFEGRPLALTAWLPETAYHWSGVAVTGVQGFTIAASVMMLVAADLIVFRSRFGLRIRPLADNLGVAEVLGANVERQIAIVFLIGSCLAAASGVLLSLEAVLKPTMGISPGVEAFAACVVGGIGSIRGAALAAFGVAIIGHFVSFSVPAVAPDTTAYAVLLLSLILFPNGLLGQASKQSFTATRASLKPSSVT
jgi:branched-chain amino acid transport system permease protein